MTTPADAEHPEPDADATAEHAPARDPGAGHPGPPIGAPPGHRPPPPGPPPWGPSGANYGPPGAYYGPPPGSPFAPTYREPWINPSRKRTAGLAALGAAVVLLGAGFALGAATYGGGHGDRGGFQRTGDGMRNGVQFGPGGFQRRPGDIGPGRRLVPAAPSAPPSSVPAATSTAPTTAPTPGASSSR